MLIAAAVCPHPPILLPEVTGAGGPGDEELGRLRAACHDAVAALAASQPDLIAVVGAAPDTAEYPPDAKPSLTSFSIPYGHEAKPALPLSLGIGKWLLAHTAQNTVWWGIASTASPAECLELGGKIAALAPRVAVLAMGDGPGRRARGAPGAVDPAADRYDDRVTAALAAPSPSALAALDPRDDDRLFVAGRAAWQVLAGAAARDDFDATVRYAAAPFEVTYYVATWLPGQGRLEG
jgi:hypothetical protein